MKTPQEIQTEIQGILTTIGDMQVQKLILETRINQAAQQVVDLIEELKQANELNAKIEEQLKKVKEAEPTSKE